METHCLFVSESFIERELRAENLFEEIIAKKFPNLGKERDIQFKETQSSKLDEPKEVHIKTHN